MTIHFGVKPRNKGGGFKLTIDNYFNVSAKDNTGFSFEELEDKKRKVQAKYRLNMKYFESLSRDKFNEELHKFVEANNFVEIIDLNSVNGVPGYYVIVLDAYCQIYIGIARDIKLRIMQHWSKKVPLDQLLLGVDGGLLPVDCFRALDTTRVFVRIGDEENFSDDHIINMPHEARLICKFPVDYCLNISIIFAGRDLFWERQKNLELRDLRIYGKRHIAESLS